MWAIDSDRTSNEPTNRTLPRPLRAYRQHGDGLGIGSVPGQHWNSMNPHEGAHPTPVVPLQTRHTPRFHPDNGCGPGRSCKVMAIVLWVA